MKRRYIYTLLFGVPGAIVALIVSAVVFGAAVGGLWLFVLGDSPWPSAVEKSLPVLFIVVFLAIWLGTIWAGFMVGKRFEQDAKLDRNHVLISVAVTTGAIVLILLSQVSSGNLGPKLPESRCADFCAQKGYAASSVSPRASSLRTCDCLDASGSAVIEVPLDSLGQ